METIIAVYKFKVKTQDGSEEDDEVEMDTYARYFTRAYNPVSWTGA